MKFKITTIVVILKVQHVVAEFVILTREAGGGSLSVAVEGPSKTDIELEDNKDGSCNILYYPTLPGESNSASKSYVTT